MGLRAVIFDCDGTLVDSERSYFSAFKEVFDRKGVELALEEYRFCIGKPSGCAELIAQKMGEKHVEEVMEEAIIRYREFQTAGICPIRPTVEFLHALASEKERLGLKLGLASASCRADILENLEHLGVVHFFDTILSGQDDLAEYNDPAGVNKPKPYIYLHSAKVLNLTPAECIAVEDSFSGVTAAVDAGCFTVAIPNEHTQVHDLSRAHLQMTSFANISVDDFLKKCLNAS